MNKTSHACAAIALLVAAIPACGEVGTKGSYEDDSEKGASGDPAGQPSDPPSKAKPPYNGGAGSGATTGSYNPGPSSPAPPPYTGSSSADAGAPAPGQPQMMPPNSG